MTATACMILAAGFGTRMGTLTRTQPKPLIPVAGRPLIDHALAQARGAGVGRIVVNGHYRAGQMRAYLSGMTDVAFSEEQPAILDSAGGIRHALPLLRAETIFTLNADAVWSGPNALATLAAAWDPDRMDVLALMVPQSRAVGRQAGAILPATLTAGWTGTRRARSIPGRRSSRRRSCRANPTARFPCMRSGARRWRGAGCSARPIRGIGPMWATPRGSNWPRIC